MPSCPTVPNRRVMGLFEMQHRSRAPARVCLGTDGRLSLSIDFQLKTVEIVGTKSGLQNMTNLSVVLSAFQLLDSPSNCEIVDEDPSLFDRSLRDPLDFNKFQISQMLNAKPDSRADDHQHQAQRVSLGPQQKQT